MSVGHLTQQLLCYLRGVIFMILSANNLPKTAASTIIIGSETVALRPPSGNLELRSGSRDAIWVGH